MLNSETGVGVAIAYGRLFGVTATVLSYFFRVFSSEKAWSEYTLTLAGREGPTNRGVPIRHARRAWPESSGDGSGQVGVSSSRRSSRWW